MRLTCCSEGYYHEQEVISWGDDWQRNPCNLRFIDRGCWSVRLGCEREEHTGLSAL